MRSVFQASVIAVVVLLLVAGGRTAALAQGAPAFTPSTCSSGIPPIEDDQGDTSFSQSCSDTLGSNDPNLLFFDSTQIALWNGRLVWLVSAPTETGTEHDVVTLQAIGPGTVATGYLGVCTTRPAGIPDGFGDFFTTELPSGCSIPEGTPAGVLDGTTNFDSHVNTHHIFSYGGSFSAIGTVHPSGLVATAGLGERLSDRVLAERHGETGGVLTSLDVGIETTPAAADPAWHPWLDIFGMHSSLNGDSATAIPASNSAAGGFAAGFAAPVAPGFEIGAALEGGTLGVRVPDTDENASGAYLQGGPYAVWQHGPLSVALTTLAGRLAITTHTPSGEASYGIGFGTLAVEAGYAIKGDGMTIEPMGGLRWVGVSGDPFIETGSPFALSSSRSSYQAVQAMVGVEISSQFDIEGVRIDPYGFAHLTANLGDHSGTVVAALGSGGGSFDLVSAAEGPFRAEFGAGAALSLEGGAKLDAALRMAVSSGGMRRSAELNLKVPF